MPQDVESAELLALAKMLCARTASHEHQFEELIAEAESLFDATSGAIERERVCEAFSQSLRHLWIEASVVSTSENYRSPTAEHETRTATGRSIEFGYERDLHPTYLEERCARFFGDPQPGWTADHILLSSGQSAMAAAFHALEDGYLLGGERKLSLLHFGAYFETAEVLPLFCSLLKPAGAGRRAVNAADQLDADVFIIEPVFCDGEFGSVDVAQLVERHRVAGPRSRVYIFDTTMTGTAYSLEEDLLRMRPLEPPAVFRVVSGLKLLQGGLELSSVGILSVFVPDHAEITAKDLGDRIRKIRTLLGLGLSFADVAVLEAPWFLHRDYTRVYQQAVFDNNARLACAVASSDHGVFRGIIHPSVLPQWSGPRDAPYCVFRLRSGDASAYDALQTKIRDEAKARDILFAEGGSFGFRGHRFEVVKPEDGSEPFLRVALGRRTGPSLDRIVTLFGSFEF